MDIFYIVDEQNIASKIMDGEAIAINLVTGDYFCFSGSGAVAWQALMKGADLDRVMAAVEVAFEPVPPIARQQISDFLALLVEEHLVKTVPAEIEPAPLDAKTGEPAPYVAPGIDKFDDMAMMLALDPPMPELPVQMAEKLRIKGN